MPKYNNKEIFDVLHKYWIALQNQGHTVYAIMLKGSQNYNLDDEESDIDANAIIIPTLSELRTNKTYKYEFDEGEVTCHNIYSFAEIVAKGNPQWIEVCHTEYHIGNSIDMFKHYELNPSALKGMVMEKVVAFSKLYPARKHIVEKYGYDGKQLGHIIRLYDLLLHNVPIYKYSNKEKQYHINIKRHRQYTLEEAIKVRDEYVEKLNQLYENRKLQYSPQKVNYEELDKIVIKEFCNNK